MKKIKLYESLMSVLPEGKRLPSNLDKDLRKVSADLEHANTSDDVMEIMQENSLLRNRINAAAGVSAAQAFDGFVNELKK